LFEEERRSNRLRLSSMAKIVAVGLLTQRDLDALGGSCQRLWPVDETPCFAGLLEAIDEADRELRRERNKAARTTDKPRPGFGHTRT
jgi:hypothetical protein